MYIIHSMDCEIIIQKWPPNGPLIKAFAAVLRYGNGIYIYKKGRADCT